MVKRYVLQKQPRLLQLHLPLQLLLSQQLLHLGNFQDTLTPWVDIAIRLEALILENH